ncbi:MAG TPA: ATP-binding cassette domain-containing protein [Gemmatimonadetes bacterium]|jgi:ATPase subunit of ABC transporter with duplicated ATPase domains|nr:ATP-binding cassette domain-containing protein [Gemmatimonadota bacterium]
MISISNITKIYGNRTLFANVSSQINLGDRCGLVGANGSGKTTLLSILGGDIEPSAGSVTVPKRLRMGMLRQDQYLYEDRKIISVAMMGHSELWEAMEAKEILLANAEEEFDADRFSDLEETIQLNDGYTAEARATKILEGLGLPVDVHQETLSTLSGGFKLRVLLAQVLASSPDVLLLDEPTNHLDILSIRWLETFLRDFVGAVVVISHDHRFLDNVSNKILDVDYETVLMYTGNYSQFLKAKVSERERREKEISSRKREISEHQKFVDRFRAKASKARQAQSKIRMIEKKADALVTLPPSSRKYPTFRFEQQRASGRDVLKVKGVKKAYGDKQVLNGVDMLVERGDRLAIMGPNGIGKSTLLKIIMGELQANEGEIEWGYETHLGYFPQDNKDHFKLSKETAEGWIWGFCPEKDIGYVRSRMALMLFTGDESKKRLSALSGGEAARLVFSRLSMLNPNVLVLDEPTNHLDLESIEALVKGLKKYDGTLVFVSHDRWFVGQLANRILEIKPEDILDYKGTYEEYVHFCGDDHLDVDRVVLKAKQTKKLKKKITKTSNRENVKHGGSEQEKEEKELWIQIDVIESRIKEIDHIFADPNYYERSNSQETADLSKEKTELEKQLEDFMSAWESMEKRKEIPE